MALYQALAALATDEDRRRIMGARGRDKAEREYDSKVNAGRIVGLMKGITGRDN